MGRGDFGGSVGAQQTDKILRMALAIFLKTLTGLDKFIFRRPYSLKSTEVNVNSAALMGHCVLGHPCAPTMAKSTASLVS